MKILIVDVNYGVSSTGRISYELSKYLKQEGHTVLTVYGRGDGVEGDEAVKISESYEILAHAGMSRLTGLNGVFSSNATRKAIRLVEEFNPDVIHLHELHGYYINIFDFVGFIFKNGIPLVWTFHCEYMYTGKCGHAFECTNYLAECGACPQLREYPTSYFFDKTAMMLSMKKKLFSEAGPGKVVFVAPSEWGSSRIKETFLNRFETTVIYNGIDLDSFYVDEKFPQSNEKISNYALTVSKDVWTKNKGGNVIKELARNLPEINFVVVGARHRGTLPKNVTVFPAILNKFQLAQLYRSSSFYLLTSIRETFSLPCAESLACGRPVIGFEAGAPVTIYPKGYAEFCRTGDVSQLSEKINDYMIEGNLVFFSPKILSDFAHSNFSYEVMCEKYVGVYEKIVDRVS